VDPVALSSDDVIPAEAGIQRLSNNATGSPLARGRRARRVQSIVGAIFGSALVICNVAAADIDSPLQPRQRQLLRLLKQDCGSCHGLRLTGGLGPALTPQALKDKPAGSLAATILYGRAGTAMPPWRPFLSEAEAQWLVGRMREGATDAP